MIAVITSLLGDFWPYIAGGIAILIAAMGLRKSGANSLKVKQAKDAAERANRARKGAAKAKKDLTEGKTPAEIVEDNNAKWGD